VLACQGIPQYWSGETLTPDPSGLVIMPSFQITFG
jgi:hypothetical protein